MVININNARNILKYKKHGIKMMRKIKRGVSPVIATVLLIGMVIVLGLIVFTWMKALTKEAITKFDGENVEIICRRVSFDAEYSGGGVSIINRENVPIYQMKAKLISSGGYDTVYLDELIKKEIDGSIKIGSTPWPRYGLDAEDSFFAEIDTKGASEIVLIPVLLGNADTDKKKFTCEESVGRKITVA